MQSPEYQKEWRERNRDRIEEYNAYRREEYALRRGPMERSCANPDCGLLFEAGRVDQRTCSRKCRSRLGQLRRSGKQLGK
jgi:hypothetical protein